MSSGHRQGAPPDGDEDGHRDLAAIDTAALRRRTARVQRPEWSDLVLPGSVLIGKRRWRPVTLKLGTGSSNPGGSSLAAHLRLSRLAQCHASRTSPDASGRARWRA
ncbi:MAG: hypothetical protein M3256_17505 [Actinomycetota bacterium]|nr:hypothetical protein [Actinomycetota bacterium]